MGRRIICDDSGSLVNFLNALDDNHFVPSFKFIKYAAYLERFIFAKHRRFFFFLTSLMELYFKRSFLILAFELCDKCEDVKSKWKEVDRIRLNICDISYNIKRKLRYLIIHFFFFL